MTLDNKTKQNSNFGEQIVFSSDENRKIVENYLALESKVENDSLSQSYLFEKHILKDIFVKKNYESETVNNIIKSMLLDEDGRFISYLSDLFCHLYTRPRHILYSYHYDCKKIIILIHSMISSHDIGLKNLTKEDDVVTSYKRIIDNFEEYLENENKEYPNNGFHIRRELEFFNLFYESFIKTDEKRDLRFWLASIINAWELFSVPSTSTDILREPYKFISVLLLSIENLEITSREKYYFLQCIKTTFERFEI